jgi:hypothetical protein
MLVLLPVFLLLGLFLPGYLVARCLRHSLWGASAYVISLPILFHCVFWLGIAGVPIKLWTVLPLLIGVCGAAAWAQRKFALPAEKSPRTPWTWQERILLVSSAVVGAILLVHSARSPFIGQDTLFRWDFLAQRLMQLGKFNFYPPLQPADFRTYFYVDGIPPMVSFTHWWLYASAGEYLPSLVCILVAAEFACTLAFAYGAASALFSRRAGILAAAILAASPLYFRAVLLGQETGLTALSIAAMLYFMVTARKPKDVPAMVSAGLAAALCALSREYGWIALIVGVLALAWRRQGLKQIYVFAAVAAAVAAPWYIRNWALAGNPLYSLRFGGFAVNPIHDAILHSYSASLGVQNWTASVWVSVFLLVFVLAIFQVLAGIPGGFQQFRERGYLIVIALVLAGVWVLSVGYTSGGAEISMRVLSPALVVLSITGAGALESLMRRARWRTVVPIAIGACQFWTAAQGMFFPNDPLSLRPDQWLSNAFPAVLEPAEFQLREQFKQLLPHGYRVLSDSAYLHAALTDAGIDVVPVWSPEVRFLFSAPPEESDRRLASLRIASVVCYPRTLNGTYLASASPFYAALPQRWRVLAQSRNAVFILVPKTP